MRVSPELPKVERIYTTTGLAMNPQNHDVDYSSLEHLGFTTWYRDHVDLEQYRDRWIARVTAVNKDNYEIQDGKKSILAEITGKLEYGAVSPLDFPAVGDWVITQLFDDETFAVIHEILPRRSVLKRKKSGKKIEVQLIAANVDKAMIVQSLDVNFSLRRLERYLVMVLEEQIVPMVLLSKSDLVSGVEAKKKIDAIHKIEPDLTVVAFSNQKGSDIRRIRKLTGPGETFCLLGSSGVGKTTLLNHLMKEERFETQDVREKDGKGRHTTARRHLIQLHNGAMIIDTPGMRELGNLGVETGIEEVFDEITELSPDCRYSDCTHTHEEGCAVTMAVDEGKIPEDRYASYLKLRKEAMHYESSYLEKRRKDRQFGRMVKAVKKKNIKKR